MTTVDAVIPAIGSAPGLRSAVESALAQSAPVEGAIVVDDGLDQDARHELEEIADPRLQAVEGPRRGAAGARNAGLRASTADWVAFLDADDIWLPDHVGRMLERIHEAEGAAACFGGAQHVGDDGRPLATFRERRREATLEDLLFRRFQPTTSATAVHRESALAVGGFYEGFEHPAGVEDTDLWWRIAAGHLCVVQGEPLVRYVIHEARDRARTRAELSARSRDHRRCVERMRGAVPTRRLRRAAAEQRALMARYWYLAGYRREGLSETLKGLLTRPTPSGVAALALGLLPTAVAERARRWRRRAQRALKGIRASLAY